MSKLTSSLFLVFFNLIFLASSFAATDVEFLFDVSGSMAKKLNGEAQIDIARKALVNALSEIPSEELVAVRVFAHRVEQTDKAASCKDTELLVPFGKADIGAIALAMGGLAPKGYTPIAYSLEKTAEDMIAAGKTRESNRVIILLSDGEETCGGDPVAVLKRLRAQGFEVVVHTIGFNVDEVARKQLQDIAAFSGGRYFDATDSVKLGEAFKEATKESYLADKEKDDYATGIEIRGGDGFISAVEFKREWLGKEVRLDHHLNRGDKDYFYLDMEPGEVLSFGLRNLDKGIRVLRDGRIEETVNTGDNKIIISDASYKQLDIVSVYRNFDNASDRVSVMTAQRVYLQFGNAAIHKDGTVYKIALEKRGDLGTDKDAGATIEAALPLKPGRYDINFLELSDEKDIYQIDGKAGHQYTFTYRPASGNESSINVYITDDLNIGMNYNAKGGGSAQGYRATFATPTDGAYFITIKRYGSGGQYSIELKEDKVE